MSEKILAIIAYLFSLPGILVAALLGRKKQFCLHHVRRSLELFLFMAGLFVIWFVVMYILLFIPYAGFPVAITLFGIVVAAFVFSVVLCITGIVGVIRGTMVVFPFISAFMKRIEPVFTLLGLHEAQQNLR